MAQDFAPLLRSIWSDDDWRALSMDAQHVYLMLLSHPDRNSAGVLSLTMRKWTRLAGDMSAERLQKALGELDDAGFVVVDEDTEEVLVRAFIRRATVYKHIRMLVNALREVSEVESERLRSALGQELMRLPRLAIPATNTKMAAEAETAQQRVDELASMLCDAPPDPPGQSAADPMGHPMAHPIGHPPVVVAGAVAVVGAGAVGGSESSFSEKKSLERNARASSTPRLVADPRMPPTRRGVRMTAEPTRLEFETAAEVCFAAFGPENRVLIGLEVRMAERQADGSIRVHKARWGWDEEKP